MARQRASGFSLVELMVGLLLGLILIAGAVSVYLASRRSFVEVEQVATLSENGRFAEQILSDSLRHVGFLGEVSINRIERDSNLSNVVGDCTGDAAAYDVANFAFAATVDGSGNALGCITDGVPGTDVVVVKHAIPIPFSDGPRDAGDPNDPAQNDGVIDSPTGLDSQKTYVMTNDIRGVLFDGGDTAPTIVTGGEVPGGVAWEYAFEVFYVRDRRVGERTLPQLSRKVLQWNGSAMAVVTEDLVDGVENLRLLFGFDSDNDGEVDTYADVATVAASDWANVTSMEVYLLLRSAEQDVQYTDTKTYMLGGTAVDPNEPNYRRLLTQFSISLRNIKLIIRGNA